MAFRKFWVFAALAFLLAAFLPFSFSAAAFAVQTPDPRVFVAEVDIDNPGVVTYLMNDYIVLNLPAKSVGAIASNEVVFYLQFTKKNGASTEKAGDQLPLFKYVLEKAENLGAGKTAKFTFVMHSMIDDGFVDGVKKDSAWPSEIVEEDKEYSSNYNYQVSSGKIFLSRASLQVDEGDWLTSDTAKITKMRFTVPADFVKVLADKVKSIRGGAPAVSPAPKTPSASAKDCTTIAECLARIDRKLVDDVLSKGFAVRESGGAASAAPSAQAPAASPVAAPAATAPATSGVPSAAAPVTPPAAAPSTTPPASATAPAGTPEITVTVSDDSLTEDKASATSFGPGPAPDIVRSSLTDWKLNVEFNLPQPKKLKFINIHVLAAGDWSTINKEQWPLVVYSGVEQKNGTPPGYQDSLELQLPAGKSSLALYVQNNSKSTTNPADNKKYYPLYSGEAYFGFEDGTITAEIPPKEILAPGAAPAASPAAAAPPVAPAGTSAVGNNPLYSGAGAPGVVRTLQYPLGKRVSLDSGGFVGLGVSGLKVKPGEKVLFYGETDKGERFDFAMLEVLQGNRVQAWVKDYSSGLEGVWQEQGAPVKCTTSFWETDWTYDPVISKSESEGQGVEFHDFGPAAGGKELYDATLFNVNTWLSEKNISPDVVPEAGAGAPASPAASIDAFEPSKVNAVVLEVFNEIRAEKKLVPLTLDPALSATGEITSAFDVSKLSDYSALKNFFKRMYYTDDGMNTLVDDQKLIFPGAFYPATTKVGIRSVVTADKKWSLYVGFSSTGVPTGISQQQWEESGINIKLEQAVLKFRGDISSLKRDSGLDRIARDALKYSADSGVGYRQFFDYKLVEMNSTGETVEDIVKKAYPAASKISELVVDYKPGTYPFGAKNYSYASFDDLLSLEGSGVGWLNAFSANRVYTKFGVANLKVGDTIKAMVIFSDK
ncbi:Uncharacterised protein [uncultured archaeon]|nr:Uncharacterised protein [uncultured archaeon]